MERGTYVAASNGMLEFARLDVVNNNLANINTAGFKRQYIVSQARDFKDCLSSLITADDPYAKGDEERSPAVVQVGTYTDFSQGSIKETGNPLDVALRNPNDFFVVETSEGLQYTRAGDFTLNEEGALVTPDGCVVQGDGGALIANGSSATLSSSGSLIVDGENVGNLQVVRFDDPQVLEHVGGNRFRLRGGANAPEMVEADLVTNSIETSNVSAVTAMIQLITTNRGFQMYERTARTIDEMNNIAVQQIGRKLA